MASALFSLARYGSPEPGSRVKYTVSTGFRRVEMSTPFQERRFSAIAHSPFLDYFRIAGITGQS
jgi:hypothetical protein